MREICPVSSISTALIHPKQKKKWGKLVDPNAPKHSRTFTSNPHFPIHTPTTCHNPLRQPTRTSTNLHYPFPFHSADFPTPRPTSADIETRNRDDDPGCLFPCTPEPSVGSQICIQVRNSIGMFHAHFMAYLRVRNSQ